MIKQINFKKMNYLKKVLASILIISSTTIKGQSQPDLNNDLKKYNLETPDVYSFEKYSLSNINHYVGKTEISVPIYTIKTGNIEYPLNLV